MKKQLQKRTIFDILDEKLEKEIQKRNDEFGFSQNIFEYYDIEYTNRENDVFLMDIFKPKNMKNVELPIIIIVHGGGLFFGTKNLVKRFARKLTEKGFLIFSLEYRKLSHVDIYEQIDDICAGMDAIGKLLIHFDVDFTKIFLVSDSAGSFLSTYAVAMEKSIGLQNIFGYKPSKVKIKAMCDICGLFYVNKKNILFNIFSKFCYGKRYKEIKLKQYDNLEDEKIIGNLPPTLFVSSDYDFLKNDTVQYSEAFKKNNKLCKTIIYKNNKKLKHVFPLMQPNEKESNEVIEEIYKWFSR